MHTGQLQTNHKFTQIYNHKDRNFSTKCHLKKHRIAYFSLKILKMSLQCIYAQSSTYQVTSLYFKEMKHEVKLNSQIHLKPLLPFSCSSPRYYGNYQYHISK